MPDHRHENGRCRAGELLDNGLHVVVGSEPVRPGRPNHRHPACDEYDGCDTDRR